jgi:hypothetical protein
MPRTSLTVLTPTTTSVAPTYTTVDNTNGNAVTWPGAGLLLHVKNTNAATRTLTLTTTNTVDGMAITSPTYTIAATTGDHMIALSSAEIARLAVSGILQLDWSASTNTSIAVIQMR